MKKFILFVSYFARKNGSVSIYGNHGHYFESEVKPKITPTVLDEIAEEIKSAAGYDGIIILYWKWFDD